MGALNNNKEVLRFGTTTIIMDIICPHLWIQSRRGVHDSVMMGGGVGGARHGLILKKYLHLWIKFWGKVPILGINFRENTDRLNKLTNFFFFATFGISPSKQEIWHLNYPTWLGKTCLVLGRFVYWRCVSLSFLSFIDILIHQQ